MPKYTNKKTGQTFTSPRELSADELEELFSAAQPEPQIPITDQQFSGSKYFSEGNIGAGAARTARNVLALPGQFIQAEEEAVNKIVPMLGSILSAPAKAAGWMFGQGGELLNQATDAYTKSHYGVTFDEIASALPETKTGTTLKELNALRKEVAPVAAGAMAGGVAKVSLPPPIRAVGRALPAEHLYQTAGRLGSYESTVEGLDATIARGLKERIPFGGSFKKLRQNLNETQGKLTNIIERQVKPEINKMEAAGEKAPTAEFLAKNRQFLLEKNSDLKGAQRQKFLSVLNKLDEDFLSAEGETLTPKRMQEMKTAIHNKAVYDEAGAFAKEWEKGIGHQMRAWLEGKSPRLAAVNKRYGELANIRNSQFDEIFKSGDKLPSIAGSAPFYMAVAEPIRGAALSGSRGIIRSPQILSRSAIGIQKMREVGKKPQPEQLPRGYAPPNVSGLLPPPLFMMGGPTETSINVTPGMVNLTPQPNVRGRLLPQQVQFGSGSQIPPPPNIRPPVTVPENFIRREEGLVDPVRYPVQGSSQEYGGYPTYEPIPHSGLDIPMGRTPLPRLTPQEIIESQGLVFRGGNGSGLIFFDDPQTGSTLAIKATDFSPEAIRQKVQASRMAFGL